MAGSLNLGHVVGPAGQGVASGGTTGQYLKKASGADYDTEWASLANATQSAAGMMSATDKVTLDSLPFVSNSGLSNNNAGFHNSIFRGKNLGSALTAAQSAEIQAGTFDDLFVGDYWVINGHTHTIVDFDTYVNVGDSNAPPGHHVAVVSDGGWSSKWYDTDDTSRGYASVDTGTIRKYIKDTVEPAIIADFGSSHVIAYRALLPTTYSNGAATSWAFTDAKTELMSDVEVFGHQVWVANGAGNPYEYGHAQRQLSIFRLNAGSANKRADWWLRSVCTATSATYVAWQGNVAVLPASYAIGVRPLSLIQ